MIIKFNQETQIISS